MVKEYTGEAFDRPKKILRCSFCRVIIKEDQRKNPFCLNCSTLNVINEEENMIISWKEKRKKPLCIQLINDQYTGRLTDLDWESLSFPEKEAKILYKNLKEIFEKKALEDVV